MSPGLPPCPANWEYDHLPDATAQLTRASVTVIRFLRSANASLKLGFAQDTRGVHRIMFRGLTPPNFSYYAGNYRGSVGHRCLDVYEVGVLGSPEVGHTAATVHMEMDKFSKDLSVAAQELDFVWNANERIFDRDLKLFRLIEVASALFVYFLEIHPYANGNGHMARFMLIAMMGRHGVYFNAGFDLHPRPADPAYTQAITQYRAGNRAALHILIANCL